MRIDANSLQDWGLYSWCVFPLSGAVRDDADGEALPPYEVSHLFEPTLVSGPVNPLVGDEIPTG